MLFASSISSLPLFSRPPTPFYLRTKISYSSILLFMGSLPIPFFQCSYPVVLMKILTELQVRHSSLVFFSGGFKSSFRCWSHTPFSSFQIPSHTSAPHNNLLLVIHLFGSAEDISEGSSCLSRSVQPISRLLSHSSHLNLTGAFSLLNHSTVFLLSGP